MRSVDSILKPSTAPRPVLERENYLVPLSLPKTSSQRSRIGLLSFLGRLAATSKLAIFILLMSAVVPLSAFEAHIINVTATVERQDQNNKCNALSKGYWANHEGCSHGTGASIWETQVVNLSAQLSGVFQSYNATEMCVALWTPLCAPGNTLAAARCRAKSQLLTDEMNVVSGRLDLNALVAAADDGRAAFDNLGLTAYSTVLQALQAIEAVIANPASTKSQLTDAGDVAQRIYGFYENENPFAPFCIYDPDDVPVCYNRGGGDYINFDDSKDKENEDEDSSDTEEHDNKSEDDGQKGEVEGVSTSTNSSLDDSEEKEKKDNLEECCEGGRSSCCNRLEDRGESLPQDSETEDEEEGEKNEEGNSAPKIEEEVPETGFQNNSSNGNSNSGAGNSNNSSTERPDRPERPSR